MVLKARFCIVATIFLMHFYSASQTYVPDDNFEQALIDLGYDSGPLNDYVPTANISSITSLDVNNKNISDLTGIEDFTSLSVLNCATNSLTSLDVSKNINLTELYCRFNQITSLDVTKNVLLKILWVEQNQLIVLDVSKNPELISLVIDNNQINALDVTLNKKLVALSCTNNLITSLDVTQNTSLDTFLCDFNFLTALDVSKNTLLTRLFCGDNLLPSIDISKNINLTRFWCAKNQIMSLDVTKNVKLERLIISNNQISTIDLSKNTKLIRLGAGINLLTGLDLSNNLLLQDLLVGRNNISYLDLSNNINLSLLDVDYNNLCFVNVRNGNNSNVISFSSTNNPDLTCVIVDDVNYSNTNWTNIDPATNFLASESDCNNLVLVDSLDDFVGSSYTLPTLNNGNYYTQSGGGGTLLNAGDIITTSQTIYIYNETGCNSNQSSFNVLINNDDYFIPRYFTPNNDGSHDTWEVIDFTNMVNNVTIYDRYGKLLKFLAYNSLSWDGTYNGKNLPSNDYWYVVVLNTGKAVRGHFALKR